MSYFYIKKLFDTKIVLELDAFSYIYRWLKAVQKEWPIPEDSQKGL